MITFNITIWNSGKLKGMREVCTREFNYTELIKGVEGYQGPDTMKGELSKFMANKCSDLLDQVEDLYEKFTNHSFLGELEDNSYFGKEISDLTESQRSNLFKELNRSLDSDKIKIDSEESLDYVLSSTSLSLPPRKYIDLMDRIRSFGIRYRFK